MAIFTNNNQASVGVAGNTTIIAQGTTIKGDVVTDCNLHIDGVFEGKIDSKNTVTVGKSGNVNGTINSHKLIVSGKFIGTCECEVVEILPQGCIDGEVSSKELVIEREGLFKGQSIMPGVSSDKALSYKDTKVLPASSDKS